MGQDYKKLLNKKKRKYCDIKTMGVNIDKNEYYFSNSMQNGYLNIKDSKTIKITGGKETAKEKRELYKNERRRKKQLSNYIINQDKKKSRSLSNNRSCIDFGVKENNKYRNKR